MKQENHFDKKSNEKIKTDLIQNFAEEFRPKSHFEDFLTTYTAGKIVRYFLQFLSVLTAATLVAYPSKYFFNTWIYGIFFAAIFLFFLELAKRQVSDVGFRKYFSEGKVPVLVVLAGIVISCSSIALSVTGTPILVAEFVPPPDLISIQQIEEEANRKKAETNLFWSAQIDSAKTKKEETFAGGSWKGKIHGETKTQVYQYDTKAVAGQDSLNKYLAIIETDLTKKVASAEKENDLTKDGADKQTATVGFWTAIGCGILEVIFYIISFFLVRFRYISSIQLSGNDTPSTPKPTGGNKGNKKRNNQEQSQVSSNLQDLFNAQNDFISNKAETETIVGTVPEETVLKDENVLSETETKNRQQETKQKQSAETSVTIDDSKESRNETSNKDNEQNRTIPEGTVLTDEIVLSKSKTFILNKDVNHGTPTVKNGNKVLYYITNRNKKNESVQYYTLKQIEKMINGYSKRLRQAKEKKNLKSIATNKAKLRDWKEYRQKLNNYQPEEIA